MSEQPIRPDLADALRPWLVCKPTGLPIFKVPQRTAEMLRHDLEAAGIDYTDKAGRVADFHAFRHTYVSMVVQGGASVKVAQELARHSTLMLTIGRYAHTSLDDQSTALTALPDTLIGPTQPSKKITGEDQPGDVPVTAEGPNRAPNAHQAGDGQRRKVAARGGMATKAGQPKPRRKPKRGKRQDAARRNPAASVASASRWTRTINPLIKSQLVMAP